MENDNSRQEEARRVLDAIQQKSGKPKEDQSAPSPPGAKSNAKPIIKPFSTVGSEDAARLQELVTNSLGIKNQPAPVPEEPESAPEPVAIDPISTDQIKVMRNYAAQKPSNKPPLSTIISHALIKAYYDAVDYFKPSARADRCLLGGHQCLYCGQKFRDGQTLLPMEKEQPPAADEQNG